MCQLTWSQHPLRSSILILYSCLTLPWAAHRLYASPFRRLRRETGARTDSTAPIRHSQRTARQCPRTEYRARRIIFFSLRRDRSLLESKLIQFSRNPMSVNIRGEAFVTQLPRSRLCRHADNSFNHILPSRTLFAPKSLVRIFNHRNPFVDGVCEEIRLHRSEANLIFPTQALLRPS